MEKGLPNVFLTQNYHVSDHTARVDSGQILTSANSTARHSSHGPRPTGAHGSCSQHPTRSSLPLRMKLLEPSNYRNSLFTAPDRLTSLVNHRQATSSTSGHEHKKKLYCISQVRGEFVAYNYSSRVAMCRTV